MYASSYARSQPLATWTIDISLAVTAVPLVTSPVPYAPPAATIAIAGTVTQASARRFIARSTK